MQQKLSFCEKKTVIFFFAFPLSSGKFGKQSLRFRAAKTFFFDITIFLYQNQNPVAHMIHWRQFCTSLNSDDTPPMLVVLLLLLSMTVHLAFELSLNCIIPTLPSPVTTSVEDTDRLSGLRSAYRSNRTSMSDYER